MRVRTNSKPKKEKPSETLRKVLELLNKKITVKWKK